MFDKKRFFSPSLQFAILLGADPERASRELKESLLFEIKLANASLPREERRNASKLYHPMRLDKVVDFAPIVNWTHYVNTLLTKEIMQVLSSRDFTRNLTCISRFTKGIASKHERKL